MSDLPELPALVDAYIKAYRAHMHTHSMLHNALDPPRNRKEQEQRDATRLSNKKAFERAGHALPPHLKNVVIAALHLAKFPEEHHGLIVQVAKHFKASPSFAQYSTQKV